MSDSVQQIWWDDRVEAFVDGDLSSTDHTRFLALAGNDSAVAAEIAAEIALARAVHNQLKALPAVSCPDHVTHLIKWSVRKDALGSWRRSIWKRVTEKSVSLLRPAMTMAVMVAVVLIAMLAGKPSQRVDPTVAAALQEVKWTLAYVSKISRQTGTTVRSEALEPLVIQRMHDAIDSFSNNQ